MKKKSWVTIALIVVVVAASLYAQKPARNVSPQRHPNLAAAQRFLGQAHEKIVAAQAANEYDLSGHATHPSLNTGLRFSIKAVMPSTASSV